MNNPVMSNSVLHKNMHVMGKFENPLLKRSRLEILQLSNHLNVLLDRIFLTRNNTEPGFQIIAGIRKGLTETRKGLTAIKRKAEKNKWSDEKLQKALETYKYESKEVYSTNDLIFGVAALVQKSQNVLFEGQKILYATQNETLTEVKKQNKEQALLIKKLETLIKTFEKKELQNRLNEEKRQEILEKRKNRTRLDKRDPISEKDFLKLKEFIRNQEDLSFIKKRRF